MSIPFLKFNKINIVNQQTAFIVKLPILKNIHEPLVTQEIWDKCREMESSVSQGQKN
jgi:hypothetical protein